MLMPNNYPALPPNVFVQAHYQNVYGHYETTSHIKVKLDGFLPSIKLLQIV